MANAAVVFETKSGPGLLVRAVWFLFVGWWLTAIMSAIAWAAMITIIGLPSVSPHQSHPDVHHPAAPYAADHGHDGGRSAPDQRAQAEPATLVHPSCVDRLHRLWTSAIAMIVAWCCAS